MRAPETTSKGRPSLLSETAPGAPDTSSRILASLEGRVSAQQLPRRRSKKPWAIAALAAVVGVGALGAWQWQRAQDAGHPVVASAASHAAGASVATMASASGTAATHVGVAQNAQGAASAPQAAVIVADNTNTASNTAASPNVTGSDPLSRALANGASSAGGASGAAASGKPSAAGKPAVAQAQHESAKSRRPEKAAEHGGKHGKDGKDRAVAKHSDSDVDLLAVLVARTKPYDAHAPQSASDAKAAAAAKGHPVSLAAQVKQCDKSNFFEAQLCRWRVCSDHWGKDPACPSANHEEQTR